MKKLLCILCMISANNLSAQNIGIGTNSPQAKLHAAGSIRMDTLAGGGKHLVYADAMGNMMTENSGLVNVNSQPGSIPFTCGAGGISRTITVTNLPAAVTSANIKVRINITHTYDADLYGYLIAPNGSILNLMAANGLSGDNFTNTVFYDGAIISLPSGSATGAPFSGIYKPTGNTAVTCTVTPTVTTFAGIGGGTIIPNGVWTLLIYDLSAGDDGDLVDWGISFDGSQPPAPNYLRNNYTVRSLNGLLVNGAIFDNGSSVGIATNTPTYRFEVGGTAKLSGLVLPNGGSAGDVLIKADAGGTVGNQKGTGALGINYIISLQGIFPPNGGSGSYPDQMVGEIRMFAGTYAPGGWAFCQGQILTIASNTSLFNIIGTIYGGNGVTTFALPDLRGSVPVHPGTSPALSNWVEGEKH